MGNLLIVLASDEGRQYIWGLEGKNLVLLNTTWGTKFNSKCHVRMFDTKLSIPANPVAKNYAPTATASAQTRHLYYQFSL